MNICTLYLKLQEKNNKKNKKKMPCKDRTCGKTVRWGNAMVAELDFVFVTVAIATTAISVSCVLVDASGFTRREKKGRRKRYHLSQSHGGHGAIPGCNKCNVF